MADTTVFVDNAVAGRLPGEICAGTGRPADGWLTLEAAVGRPSPFRSAWFIPLAVLGTLFPPLGLLLIGLAMLWRLTAHRESTPVRIPWSEDHHVVLSRLERRQRRGHALLFTGIVAAWLAAPLARRLMPSIDGLPAMFMVLAALSFAAGLGLTAVSFFQARNAEVTAHLDASRRWVTLQNVHPDFAVAVNASAAAQHPAR